MHNFVEIKPHSGGIDATIVLPGSKSETIRALICAALAEGTSRIENALFCDDTLVVAESLRRLGMEIEADRQKTVFEVHGCGGNIPATGAELDLKGCAAGMRFLTSVAALGHGEYYFDGDESLRRRPLLVPLSEDETGTQILFHKKPGHLPFTVAADGIQSFDSSVDCSATSQALSSLLMIGPCSPGGARIEAVGETASAPYVELTLKVMREFGTIVKQRGQTPLLYNCGGGYVACNYRVEGDASSAAYFLAAAAITGGRVRAVGFGRDSVQADARFADILERMGCIVEWAGNSVTVIGPEKLRAVKADFFAMPDSAPTFATVAAFADGVSTMTGIRNLSLKESNRIDSIAKGLGALGVKVESGEDCIHIHPGKMRGGEVDPQGDHRIAMSCALVGLKVPGVRILQPECVRKSLPNYFQYLDFLSSGSTG